MVPAIALFCAGLCPGFFPGLGAMQAQTTPIPLARPLVFTDAERFWSDPPTPFIYGPTGCSADGAVYLYSVVDFAATPVRRRSNAAGGVTASTNITDPAITENTPMQLEVVEPGGRLQTYDVTHIDDLQGIKPTRAYDVGENDVIFLLSAIPKKGQTIDPTARRGNYLARFNRQGQYLGATEVLLPGLAPEKLAVFPSGEVLIFAIDENSRQPQLVRYSLFNQQATPYAPDEPFAATNNAVTPPFPENYRPSPDELVQAQLVAAVRNTQMVHAGDAIYVLQMNAGSPLYESYANGSIRSIDLPQVDNYTADSLIPSDAFLYVRYRRIGSVNKRGEEALSSKGDDSLILEINPASGDAIRRIPPGNLPVWDVACVRNHTMRAVRWKGPHDYGFLTAALH